MAGLAANILGIFLSKPLDVRFGKRNTFLVCLSLTAILTALFFFLPPSAIAPIFVLQILLQFAYGPTIPMLWAMMADVADFSEWKTGRRATGLVFSAAVFGLKAGLGLGGALSGWMLSLYGYVANAEQTATALSGIRLMMSVYPAIAFIAGVGVLCFYPIDKTMAHTMQNDLVERRKQFVYD
jgi:Na+/melibiose symporter-like transporter